MSPRARGGFRYCGAHGRAEQGGVPAMQIRFGDLAGAFAAKSTGNGFEHEVAKGDRPQLSWTITESITNPSTGC